jgi:hypothetical protein
MGKNRKLLDEYRFPGFRPMAKIKGVFGDPKARVITLRRTQKKRYAAVVELHIEVITTSRRDAHEICLAGMLGYIWNWKCGESIARGAGK